MYVLVCILIYAFTFKTICKPWHWNLGVGIGFEIGTETDVISVTVSTSTRPIDSKLIRVVTQEKKTPLQSHMTHPPRGHVTNQKRCISTFTIEMVAKIWQVGDSQ